MPVKTFLPDRVFPHAFAGLLLGLALGLPSCHSDVTCVYDTDCASQGSTDVCVPDSSGFGHCVPAADVFGLVNDGGSGKGQSCDGGTTLPATDAGSDAGAGDAGSDAGEDAGSVPDAGSTDAGAADAGSDAGPSDAGPPDGGSPDGSVDAG
ncbi:MAG: hypothetical protein ACYCWW_16050 [Deltaproteobacteria bacterium]